MGRVLGTLRANRGSTRAVPGGNPDAGRVAIRAYGCGACHTVPGIRGVTQGMARDMAAYLYTLL